MPNLSKKEWLNLFEVSVWKSNGRACAPPEPRQVCADRSLVDKHQPGGIKKTLLSYPTSACSRDV